LQRIPFGRRLRAVGVSFEDRQDLLGHKSGRITTHYSVAELKNLYEAANRVCKQNGNNPTLALLKRKVDYQKLGNNIVDLSARISGQENSRSRKNPAKVMKTGK